MAAKEIYEAAGFSFPSKEQADAAAEEEKKIYYIKSRLNKSDIQSVLVIYNKMIKGNVLKTPVGVAFLKELHDELIKNPAISQDQIDSIPFGASYMDDDRVPKSREVILTKKNEELESCRTRLRICGVVIAGLLLCIIAMFAITMKSENPNILNYETAIQNKYAQWEQELTEREKKVRAKEQELGY